MSRPRTVILCSLLALATPLLLPAEDAMPGPNWARRALLAAGTVDAVVELRPLFERARAGQDDELLQRLQRIAANERWPQPARERILHAFALGLGELPPGSVGPDVLGYLLAWQPRTRVPHADNERIGVPLFDVGNAAAGAVNTWERRVGQDSASSLLEKGGEEPSAAERWIGAYLAAGPARRQGFVDALDGASPERLRELAAAALGGLAQAPDLTPPAARCAILLADPALLRQALVAGRGPGLASALMRPRSPAENRSGSTCCSVSCARRRRSPPLWPSPRWPPACCSNLKSPACCSICWATRRSARPLR
jgi:hypothetical protein